MQGKIQLDFNIFSESSFMATYITSDEKTYVVEINYRNGKFVSEKQFPNNTEGVAQMEELRSLYRSEFDIQRYFGII